MIMAFEIEIGVSFCFCLSDKVTGATGINKRKPVKIVLDSLW